ncbi:hypothetical protein DFH08DRAFT_817642 [Mycena albidolilacea]|uniref:Uncharacterized protein n=1 Tax=Mycena albidolilacea TaxID=1033008 RepID=A0AAD6ZJ74_9AGAR|nr:hypothetical protein DFH08DRAFT_817642 [Mycena albidolilacea]
MKTHSKTRAASHRTHVLAKSKKARSPSPNWEINSQDFAPHSPSSAHSPNPSKKRLVSNSSVSIPSGSDVKTKKLAEPSAIKYRNANQPRGGSNGCIANTLLYMLSSLVIIPRVPAPLIHHLITGTCFDNFSNTGDAFSSQRHELATYRAVSRGYCSAADVSEDILNIILNANRPLCSCCCRMNISVSGNRNLRFKLRAAIRKKLLQVNSAEGDNRSSVSVADFFNSFESHRKPALLSIAALHRIQLPKKPGAEEIRQHITTHIISGHCAHFSGPRTTTTLPEDVSLPDYTDVCNEWKVNAIHPDLQVHILNALYGSNLTLNPLRRLLTTLGIDYSRSESLRELRNKLRERISTLRKGKHAERKADAQAERTRLQRAETRAFYEEESRKIIASWPQLVPQSLKNNIINMFREQTSSEALATYNCASCSESVPFRSHCSLPLDEFDSTLLQRPDLKANENLVLDCYKGDAQWIDQTVHSKEQNTSDRGRELVPRE